MAQVDCRVIGETVALTFASNVAFLDTSVVTSFPSLIVFFNGNALYLQTFCDSVYMKTSLAGVRAKVTKLDQTR